MNTISRILGEARRPPTEMELSDPRKAFDYAFYIHGPFPKSEAAMATDPLQAYNYAQYVLNGPTLAVKKTQIQAPNKILTSVSTGYEHH